MKAGIGGILLSSSGVFGAALGWLLSFKILAFWLGPEGVGLFAQLRQIVQTGTLVATYGGTNVVVQGLVDRKNESSRKRFRVMAAWLIGSTGVGIVMMMLVAAPQFAWLALSSGDQELIRSIRWLAIAVLINVAATYLMAVLNGYQSYGHLALAQVSGPAVLSLLLFGAWKEVSFAPAHAMAMALLAGFGVTCLVGVWGVLRLPLSGEAGINSRADEERLPVLFRFALSNLAAAMSTVIALLIIRSWIIGTEGLALAGLFDAGWTLTFNYTTLFLTACNTLYLPMLTAASAQAQQKACMLKTTYLILGVSLLICYALVLWQIPLIQLFYSPQFEASGQVLSVLVIAVIFRGISWVYGTLMLATHSAKAMLLSEVMLNLGLLVATRYVLDNHATLASLGWAFVGPHFLYLVFVIEYVRSRNPLMLRRHIWPLLAMGVLPLVYLALVQSKMTATSRIEFWPFMAMGVCVSLLAFRAYKRVKS